ncbi:MAG: 2-phosphosulfolactate phosphatase [Cytophagales bacterium]|nr:2-phosphosulfolactate phosphatase [Cytophagales bacterium]
MDYKPSVEVCFSPMLYGHKLTDGKFVTVVVDILRATTSICAAFDHGVKEIIPVSGLEEAKDMKKKGYFVACERNGQVMDFADLGNSASDFIRDDIVGQQVVFSTTNGTKTIHMARDAGEVLIGSFVNIQALADYLIEKKEPVVIFCAAWKGLFNLEDSVFSGALAQILLNNGFSTVCDSVLGSVDLWKRANQDLKKYLSKSSHRNRLKHLVSDEDFTYTVTLNSTRVVPFLNADRLQIKK